MKATGVCGVAWFLTVATVLAAGQAAPEGPERQTTAPGIPGVVAAGTKVERIWTGNQSSDGVIAGPDGSLLFPEQAAHRIGKIDPNGKVSVFLENTNATGGIGFDPKGRIIAVERGTAVVSALTPTRVVLADQCEDQKFRNPSDIVVNRHGGTYFTAPRGGDLGSIVCYISPDGKVRKITDKAPRANGIQLSRDEKILYVGNRQTIEAFDINPDGSVHNQRTFATTSGVDGLAIDSEGRVYAALTEGVAVFSPEGKHLGTIPTPRQTTSIAFAGPDKRTLYIVGRFHDGPDGKAQWARSMYKVSMLAQGFMGRPK